MNKEKMIFEDSPEAATPVQITAFRDVDGRIFVDEQMARWSSSTHKKCNVDGHKPYPMNSYCYACYEQKEIEKFKAMPKEEWDESGFICTLSGDDFYGNWDDLICDVIENDIDPSSLMLLHCEPAYARAPDPYDIYEELIPDGGDLPCPVVHAYEELAKALEKCQPISYFPTNKAVIIPPYFYEKYEEAKADASN